MPCSSPTCTSAGGWAGPREGAGWAPRPIGARVGVAGPGRPCGGHRGQPPCEARQDVDTGGSSRLIYYLIKGSRHRWWTASGRTGARGRGGGRPPGSQSSLPTVSREGRTEESGSSSPRQRPAFPTALRAGGPRRSLAPAQGRPHSPRPAGHTPRPAPPGPRKPPSVGLPVHPPDHRHSPPPTLRLARSSDFP